MLFRSASDAMAVGDRRTSCDSTRAQGDDGPHAIGWRIAETLYAARYGPLLQSFGARPVAGWRCLFRAGAHDIGTPGARVSLFPQSPSRPASALTDRANGMRDSAFPAMRLRLHGIGVVAHAFGRLFESITLPDVYPFDPAQHTLADPDRGRPVSGDSTGRASSA